MGHLVTTHHIAGGQALEQLEAGGAGGTREVLEVQTCVVTKLSVVHRGHRGPQHVGHRGARVPHSAHLGGGYSGHGGDGGIVGGGSDPFKGEGGRTIEGWGGWTLI